MKQHIELVDRWPTSEIKRDTLSVENDIDITVKIGPMDCHQFKAEWPMYSYGRPATILWNAIANRLHSKGWSEAQIKEWLQSKETRWALDGELGDALGAIGAAWVDKNVR
jgi:hypothetical protein